MHEYIFRFPEHTPTLTYASLSEYLGGNQTKRIGSTVKVSRRDDSVTVHLYDFRIAVISMSDVTFLPDGDDGHQATTEWVSRIAGDNHIANRAWRVRRRKSDGPGITVARGEAGVLVFDGDRQRPVVETTYQTQIG